MEAMVKNLKNLERKREKSTSDEWRSAEKPVSLLNGYTEYTCATTEANEVDMRTYKPESR